MANVATSTIITLIRGLIKDRKNTDGRNAFEYASDNSFKLSEDYIDSDSITVYQNGSLLPSTEWNYNSDTNKVTLTMTGSGYSLTEGDNILIPFSYYEKYSDAEITDYIKSSLVHFTTHRYPKHFYVNSNSEVVTLNGNNPTEEEGNIIASVTAVEIDPKNVTIKTRDFTIGAEEDMSKSQQIDEIFNKFTRSFGVLDFLEDEI